MESGNQSTLHERGFSLDKQERAEFENLLRAMELRLMLFGSSCIVVGEEKRDKFI